jgi:hypothetical protein
MQTLNHRRSASFALACSLAICMLPAPARAAELDGSWMANGYRYSFAIVEDYSGRVSIRNANGAVARGFRNGYRIELTSQDGTSTPWTGQISSVRGGIPMEIQMSNGTVLRKIGFLPPVDSVDPPAFARGAISSAPGQPPVPRPGITLSVAGVYSSNLGFTYRLSQTGNSFRWTIDGLEQRGQGTIAGNRVQASWQGPLVRGAGGGTLVGGARGVERIDFDNGTVLTLQ